MDIFLLHTGALWPLCVLWMAISWVSWGEQGADISVRGGLASQRKCGTLVDSFAKGAQGDRCPMRCLHESIRQDDPGVQRLLSAVDAAPSLSALILAAWQVARVLTVHLVAAVLAERARPPTLWPRGPQCGAGVRSTGLAKRQITSLCGPIK